MDIAKLKLNKYIVPLLLFVYLVVVTFVFYEHVSYFKAGLAQAFADPPSPEQIIIDTNTLTKIVDTINISKDSVVLIPQKTRK